MIYDHGVIRYKPIDFGYANFKHEHFEAGVSYFNDYHYEIHKGFTFVEYKSKHDGKEYENHIYVSNTNLNHLNDLFDHWTRNGWTYEIVKIHNNNSTPAKMSVNRIHKDKWNKGNLPKNGKWFFGLSDKGMVPNVLRWHNKKWLYSTGEVVDEAFGPKYWLPIPDDPE